MSEVKSQVDRVLGEEIGDVTAMERWIGSVAVVTGVTSRVGTAICKRLLQSKINVVGLSRQVHLVEELGQRISSENSTLFPLPCDLTDEQEIVRAFQWIEKNLGPISMLVNNAESLTPTNLIEGDATLWRRTVDVNFMALALCARQAARSMVKHNVDGHILNITTSGGSVSGTAMPCFGVCLSTKNAVRAFSVSLRREIDYISANIKVSMISLEIRNSQREGHIINDGDSHKMSTLQPDDVAEACIYILGTPPHVVIENLMLCVFGDDV